MTCFTSILDVNRYSRNDVSDPRTRHRVDVADHRDPRIRIDESEGPRTVEVPSSDGALSAVSRVSKLPTWTRAEAAICLAGSISWTRVSIADPADGGSIV